MTVAEAARTMSAVAPARTDGHPFVTDAFPDPVVSRAASFFAERDRTRLRTFFTRTDIFLSETLRSDRSTLSRYRIERAGGCAFFTRTVLLLNAPFRVGLTPVPSKGAAPAAGE